MYEVSKGGSVVRVEGLLAQERFLGLDRIGWFFLIRELRKAHGAHCLQSTGATKPVLGQRVRKYLP